MTPEQRVIERFTVIYGEPKTADPVEYLRLYVEAIKGYSPEMLEQATGLAIKHYTFWPKPAELIAIISKQLAAPSHTPQQFAALDERERRFKTPTPEEKARVAELMRRLNAKLNSVEEPDKPRKLGVPDKPTFTEMQHSSPNPHLHMKPAALSELSRRMTGESSE